MRTFWVVTFTLLAGSAGLPAREGAFAATAATNLSLRSEQPLHQYRAFRRMHTTSENGKYEAWLYVSEMRPFWAQHLALDWARAVLVKPRRNPGGAAPGQDNLF